MKEGEGMVALEGECMTPKKKKEEKSVITCVSYPDYLKEVSDKFPGIGGVEAWKKAHELMFEEIDGRIIASAEKMGTKYYFVRD